MNWLDWVLIYFLVGFILHFVGSVLHCERKSEWTWELVATLGWPIAVVAGLMTSAIDRRRAR